MNPGTYYSHGKFLLTGEYLILDGAKGLALPAKKGQRLEVIPNQSGLLEFISMDENGSVWFEAKVDPEILNPTGTTLPKDLLMTTNNESVAHSLLNMLAAIGKHLQNGMLTGGGLTFTSVLEFPRDWGLGSSSTFINNLAACSHTDPYAILEASLGGSGYDLACAMAKGPIFFKKGNGIPEVTPAPFDPTFTDHLYFVHLNQKQNSREGIQRYRAIGGSHKEEIERVSIISEEIVQSTALDTFEALLTEHEEIIGSLLNLPTAKRSLFADFPGTIKSLGAWGGDFILATAQEDPTDYFLKKGYPTIIPYGEMIL